MAGMWDHTPTNYDGGTGDVPAMTLRMYASRHGWPLEEDSVEVGHVKLVSADSTTQTDRLERVIDLKGDLTDE